MQIADTIGVEQHLVDLDGESLNEFRNDPGVGRREIQACQQVDRLPAKFGPGFGAFAHAQTAKPEMKFQSSMRIVKFDPPQQFRRFDSQAGFLEAFPHDTVARRLAVFTFSPGEFGMPGEHFRWLPDSNENLASVLDNGNPNLCRP